MFLHEEDLGALAVILVAVGTVGVGTAIAGRQSRRSARATADRVAHAEIGDGRRRSRRVSDDVPEELARLYASCSAASAALHRRRARERASRLAPRAGRVGLARSPHAARRPPGARRGARGRHRRRSRRPSRATTPLLRVEAERLSGLVDDLFELQPDPGRRAPARVRTVSLADLVSDALAGARPSPQSKGVQLEGQVAGVPPELGRRARGAARPAQHPRERDPSHPQRRHRRRRSRHRA